jgi:hypothetical protein
MTDPDGAGVSMKDRPDLLTLAALAVVAYAVANVVHEGLGHGGACVLVGGRPLVLSSMHFEGDTEGLPDRADRLVAAGGTVANLVAAALAVLLLKRGRARSPATWFFLWTFATVNLLQATGYPLFSGVGGIGDWAAVVRGWRPAWLWRLALAVVGGASYFVAVRWAMTTLATRLEEPGARRVGTAYVYTLTPYFVGSALYVAAGLRNPAGPALVAISAVASSLGGTSGFAWGPQLLRGPDIPPASGPVAALGRSWGWVALAGLVALAFVALLGPGIHFRPGR